MPQLNRCAPRTDSMPTLAEHLKVWRKAFFDDDNAVERTLTSLAWHHAVFLSIVKAVEMAPADRKGKKKLNPYVLDLLSTSYWGAVIMAIRRLVDPGQLRGRRGVASIRSVLNDVRAKKNLITRRAFIETIAGLEYDGDAVEERFWKFMFERSEKGVAWIPPELHYDFTN